MDVTKPYEFIGFGAVDVTKPCEFIGFGAMDVTKPYEFIGFGTPDGAQHMDEFPAPWGPEVYPQPRGVVESHARAVPATWWWIDIGCVYSMLRNGASGP